MSMEDLLKLNKVPYEEPLEALLYLSFHGPDLAIFKNPNRLPGFAGHEYQGITREGAAAILQRLWFMGFDVRHK